MRTSTQQASPLNPSAASSPTTHGVPIGISLWSGAPFFFSAPDADPRDLPSTVTLTLGMLGTGKSALSKVRILRGLTLAHRQSVVLDAQGEDGRGEWADICEALGIQPVAFHPGSKARINVLDATIPTQQRIQLITALAEIACGKEMSPEQQYAIRRALAIVPPGAVLADLLTALEHPTGADADKLPGWGERPRIALDRYVNGDLAGLFDTPTRHMPDLDAPLTVFDFSGMDRNSPALPAVMAVLGVWLEHTWIRPDDTWRTLVIEEAWHLLATPATAALFQRLLKYSRRLHLSIEAILHTLSDLTSDQAKDLGRLAGTRIFHQLPAAEAKIAGEVFGLPAWTVKRIPSLGIGDAIWQTGRTIDEVACILSPVEEILITTTKGRDRIRAVPEGDTVSDTQREDWMALADTITDPPTSTDTHTEAETNLEPAFKRRIHPGIKIGALAVILIGASLTAWTSQSPEEDKQSKQQAEKEAEQRSPDFRKNSLKQEINTGWAAGLIEKTKGLDCVPAPGTTPEELRATIRLQRPIGATSSAIDIRYQSGLWCAQIVSREKQPELTISIAPTGTQDWTTAKGKGIKTPGAMLRSSRCVDVRADVPNQAGHIAGIDVTNLCADDE